MASPQKRRNFTFSLNIDDTPNLEEVKRVAEQCGSYAYILHDKDKVEKDHIHFYIEFINPRSFSSVAESLGIPLNQLQKINTTKESVLSYLIHNTPQAKADGKYEYSFNEVVTNIPEDFFKGEDTQEVKLKRFNELLDDYINYREGRMSYREFIARRQYVLCDITLMVGR